MFDIYRMVQTHWRQQRDPVYREERRLSQRIFATPVVAWQMSRYRRQLVVLILLVIAVLAVCRAGAALVLLVMAPLLLMALLIGLGVAPYLWHIPATVICAPVVAREKERRTWGVLATIPASVEEILLAKYAAALQSLQGLLLYIVMVRLLVSVPAVATGGFFMLWAFDQLSLEAVTAGLLPFLCAAYYLAEPYQDVAIDGAVGLVASTFSPSVGQSFPLAIILRLALWLAQLLALIPALALLQALGLEPRLLNQFPLLVLLGPGLGYLTDWPAWSIVLMMAVLLPLRLLWLNGLLRLAEWRARQIA